MKLSQEQISRYSRHLIMPEVGMEGQEKLMEAKVLLIGAGGLGSPNALYLAAAGVGTLGIVDFDVVDHSNLQRQVIHGSKDVGKLKVESARETIKEINPNVKVVTYHQPFRRDTALDIIREYDIVVDGTDNFQTRYLTNDACFFFEEAKTFMPLSFDLMASPRSFIRVMLKVRAIVVSIRSHPLRGRSLPVPREGSWEYCPDLLASSSLQKPLN